MVQTSKKISFESCILMDGAMGTMLQSRGLPPGECPEVWNITQPQQVERVHREYLDAGSEIICTNTFGANALKLERTGYSVREIVQAGVECAKAARKDTTARIFLDVGPLGQLVEPVGSLSMQEAMELFREVMAAGVEAGVDGIYLETMSDLGELKAAVLAAKEQGNLPIFASMSFESSGRTFLGCPVESFGVTAQALGVTALGVNCSLAPGQLVSLVERLAKVTNLPLLVKANAGLPDPISGRFSLSATEYVQQMEGFLPLGLAAVGGCCGTTPETIRQLANLAKQMKPYFGGQLKERYVCSGLRTVEVRPATVVGERLNPTGKSWMKQALETGDFSSLMQQALRQEEDGAEILDLNVGLPGVDEVDCMRRAVLAIQSVCELPLQLDSARPEVLEAGLQVYVGKPIVNSVNASKEALERSLPLCKRYGAAVIGLTMDESGLPQTSQQRVELAKRILNEAEKHGIPKEDVYIDCLALTASAQPEQVEETLAAVQTLSREYGVAIILGISNISFGLPNRGAMNATFLSMALSRGLTLAIANPGDGRIMETVTAFRVLSGQDRGAKAYIVAHTGTKSPPQPAASYTVEQAIQQGLEEQASRAARQALDSLSPQQLLDTQMMPALEQVGERFEKGQLFLPQLLQAATAAQAVFAVVKEAMLRDKKQVSVYKGVTVLATVQGDVHDIGKNIVKVVLENYGYQVIDLGRDVPPERILQAAKQNHADFVGLSALMTTTLPAMEQTVKLLHKELPGLPVIVGGAVVSQQYADAIGADFYAKDAKEVADVAKKAMICRKNARNVQKNDKKVNELLDLHSI